MCLADRKGLPSHLPVLQRWLKIEQVSVKKAFPAQDPRLGCHARNPTVVLSICAYLLRSMHIKSGKLSCRQYNTGEACANNAVFTWLHYFKSCLYVACLDCTLFLTKTQSLEVYYSLRHFTIGREGTQHSGTDNSHLAT